MNNRNSKNHTANVKNYQKRSKRLFPIMCDIKGDADVIEWFTSRKNYSGEVRKLVRDSMKKKERQNKASAELRAKRREQKICIFCANQDERTMSGKSLCESCFTRSQERQRARKNDGV